MQLKKKRNVHATTSKQATESLGVAIKSILGYIRDSLRVLHFELQDKICKKMVVLQAYGIQYSVNEKFLIEKSSYFRSVFSNNFKSAFDEFGIYHIEMEENEDEYCVSKQFEHLLYYIHVGSFKVDILHRMKTNKKFTNALKNAAIYYGIDIDYKRLEIKMKRVSLLCTLIKNKSFTKGLTNCVL